jgi:hypothetical protein
MDLGLRIGKILGIIQMAMAGSRDEWAHRVLMRARSELELNGLLRDMDLYRVGVGVGVGSWMVGGNGNGNGNGNVNGLFGFDPAVSGSMLGGTRGDAVPSVETGLSAASSSTTNIVAAAVGGGGGGGGGQIQPPAPVSAPGMHPGAQPIPANGAMFGDIPPPPPPQQQQQPPPPQPQPPPTMLRCGPPHENDEPLLPLNVYEALHTWERFAHDWMHGKAQSVLDGAKPL